MTASIDAVVIGAGPYGLAVAAELRRAGANVQAFGELMSFWMRHMPKGMNLRSIRSASHIGAPAGAHSLDVFEGELGRPLARPMPIDDFIAYGQWFQARAVPELDPRSIARVEAVDGGIRVPPAGRDPRAARRGVAAAG